MSEGLKFSIGVDPAIFSGIGNAGAAVKAQRAIVRDLMREERQLARAGQQVSDELHAKLERAQQDLQRLETLRDSAAKGGGAGLGRLGRGGYGSTEEAGGALGAAGGLIETFHHSIRMIKKADKLFKDLEGERGTQGQLEAGADAAELLSRFLPLIPGGVIAAAGLKLAAESARTTAETYDEDRRLIETRRKTNETLNKLEEQTGIRLKTADLASDFRKDAQQELAKAGSLHNFIEWIPGLGDINNSLIEEKALKDANKAVSEMMPHLQQAFKSAGMGDIARAVEEQQAAMAQTKGSSQLARYVTAQGSAMELYFRSENVRRFNKEYAASQNTRPKMRTGQYE
jgi:hypothetical protein